MKIENFLKYELDKRRASSGFRILKLNNKQQIDFSSNDYLGLAQLPVIHDNSIEFVDNGASGSRLLNGNKLYHEKLEIFLADFFKAESSLLFNSGYMANLGLISSVPQKGDTILMDELSHICIKEGARLSRANYFNFRHNDLKDLESKLKKAVGNIFVVVESFYSMDGDNAPLEEIVKLSEKYGAGVIVDEAHSTGLHGESGYGYCCDLGLEDKIFARIYTFGKAVGAHGAVVVGSQILKEYLVNYSRQFIYTTALPYVNVKTIENALSYRRQHPQLWTKLQSNICLFRDLLDSHISSLDSHHPIQGIIFSDAKSATDFSEYLNQKGFNVRPILSPTVPKGKERVRICLHAFNSKEEISNLCHHINEYFQ
ncbi:pyridoxal phosphate-dependent aminotransferase family protein [Marivirga sp.]|uniref:aminotransferase class I/II-fold pyridoxal phosphate-dependent enzyme n=1 Tax=Marivirga sp. TaxID=2018662 RepID=UPI0025FA6F35|nr:pyridoxal phosphate-dependent aminotransferase family protein [Marivirga sp.]